MPGVFRDIELTYKGKAYTFTPTIRAMREIERAGDVSIGRMVMEVTNGGPLPMFDIAIVYALILQQSGCPGADEDQVFAEMSSPGSGGDMSAYLEIIIKAISPPEMDEKKADAPAEAAS